MYKEKSRERATTAPHDKHKVSSHVGHSCTEEIMIQQFTRKHYLTYCWKLPGRSNTQSVPPFGKTGYSRDQKGLFRWSRYNHSPGGERPKTPVEKLNVVMLSSTNCDHCLTLLNAWWKMSLTTNILYPGTHIPRPTQHYAKFTTRPCLRAPEVQRRRQAKHALDSEECLLCSVSNMRTNSQKQGAPFGGRC